MKGKNIVALLLSAVTAIAFTACAGNTPSSGKESAGTSGRESLSERESASAEEKPDDTGVKSLTFESGVRDDYINWYGRDLYNDIFSSVACNNAAAGFEVSFWGTSLSVSYISETAVKGFMDGDCYVCVQVDGATDYYASFTHLPKQSSPKDFSLVKDLEEGAHTVSVYKATEDMCVSFEVYSLSTDGFFTDPPEKPELKVEAYGDSLTAGRGTMRENGDKEYIDGLIGKLKEICGGTIVLKGLTYQSGEIGVAVAKRGEETKYYFHERLPRMSHGTGDIYASVFTGALCRGSDAFSAAKLAADFTAKAIAATEPEHFYGVRFEKALPYLTAHCAG